MKQEDTKTRRLFGDGSDEVIGACIEVHRHLGSGLLNLLQHAPTLLG